MISIHIEGAVGGKMGGFFKIGGAVEFQVAYVGKWILPFRERIISGGSLFRLVP